MSREFVAATHAASADCKAFLSASGERGAAFFSGAAVAEISVGERAPEAAPVSAVGAGLGAGGAVAALSCATEGGPPR